MSEPPQPSWQGNQPNDPTAPMPPTPPSSGPPAPEPPSYGPPTSGTPSSGAPSSGAPDPFAAPPPPSYGQPSDPFGASAPPPPPPPPGYGGQPMPGQPVPGQPYPGQPYPGAPGYPGAAPPKKSNAGKIALIIGIVAVVLLCACGGVAVWAINEAGDEIEKQIDALPTADVTAPPTAEPTTDPTSGGEDFEEGDCVVNEGTDSDADLQKVTCAPGTFEVVAKIPFSTDKEQCDNDILGAGRGNYDSTYTYDETPNDLNDFVLCLKER